MKELKKYHFALLILLFITSCSKNSKLPTEPQTSIKQNNNYVYFPPNGKLPYPQHNPNYTKAQYDSMMEQLFIINNFGLWQGGPEINSQYFHDGIDIVTPNGTEIFSIEDGYVRAIISYNPYYSSILIEDKDEPDYVWNYTHVYNFKVKEGDTVKQGDLLATVNFQGVEHVHLTRAIHIPSKPWNSYYSYTSISTDNYFNYPDNEAPVIENPFYFFKDQTDTLINDSLVPTLKEKLILL